MGGKVCGGGLVGCELRGIDEFVFSVLEREGDVLVEVKEKRKRRAESGRYVVLYVLGR